MFVTVVDRGSFTAAAQALGVPKATLSRKVQALEDRLGARLLKRTTRRLGLTESGQVYYAYCARLPRLLEDAEGAVVQLSGTPRGWLRMTAPTRSAHRSRAAGPGVHGALSGRTHRHASEQRSRRPGDERSRSCCASAPSPIHRRRAPARSLLHARTRAPDTARYASRPPADVVHHRALALTRKLVITGDSPGRSATAGTARSSRSHRCWS